MAKKGIGLYLTDTIVYLCTKDKIYEEAVDKGLIIHNRIALVNEFYRFINKIIKKYKLNDSFLGKNVTIVELPNYLASDKELLNSILEKLAFNNITFLEYNEIVKDDTLNVNEENLIVTLDKKNALIDFKLFSLNDIYDELKKYLKTQYIYIIGNNSQLPNFIDYIEKDKSVKAYTYSSSNLFIIENVQKLIK